MPRGQRLVIEQHLEQRRFARHPGRSQRVDQLIERQLLVGLPLQPGPPNLFQQVAPRGRGRQPGAHDLRVHEQADHVLQPGPATPRDGHADTEVVLARVARQQCLECRQQRHEQGAAGRQAAQRAGKRGGEPTRHRIGGIRRARPLASVARQHQRRLVRVERRPPIGYLPLALSGLQQIALPVRIVGIAQPPGGNRARLAAAPIRIGLHEFLDQPAPGPAIRHDVMHGGDQ